MAKTDDRIPVFFMIAGLVATCIAIVAFAFGQASNLPARDVELPPEVTPTSVYVANLQVMALEAQLEENRAYNDRLVQLVLWSLGGVVTLAGFLVGANFFTTYRATQQERSRLERAEQTLVDLQSQAREQNKKGAILALESATHRASRYANDDDLPEAIATIADACEVGKLELVPLDSMRDLVKTINGVLKYAVVNDQVAEPSELARLREVVHAISQQYRLDVADIEMQIREIEKSAGNEDTLPPNRK